MNATFAQTAFIIMVVMVAAYGSDTTKFHSGESDVGIVKTFSETIPKTLRSPPREMKCAIFERGGRLHIKRVVEALDPPPRPTWFKDEPLEASAGPFE